MRAILPFCLATATVLSAVPAFAQAEDQIAARALFNDARELMKLDRYDQACPKLEAASRLVPGSGVFLNLGDCYEHLGRTASAWSEFGEAASAAERSGRTADQTEAIRRQGLLNEKICKLTIHVTHEIAGIVVTRDGVRVDHGAYDLAIPVDPGDHKITAEAPGHLRWTGLIKVSEPGKTVSSDVPDLELSAGMNAPAPAAVPVPTTPVVAPAHPAPPPPPPPPPAPYWSGQRVGAVTVGAIGVVAVGVGGIVALVAKGNYNTAAAETGEPRHTDSVSAYQLGTTASVVMGIGGAAVLTGIVLWLTVPSTSTQVGFDGRQAILKGTF